MGRKLYVGNRPYETGEQDLQDLFGEVGPVESVSILRSKAGKFDVHFPEEVLEFVAERFDDNVREVESALTTLSPHAKFNEKKIDIQLASDVLEAFFLAEKNY